MEKKKKKPRLKTKLQKLGIIVSLVAILVSSLLCIPSSAVEVEATDLTLFEGDWELLIENQDNGSDNRSLRIYGDFSVEFIYGDVNLSFTSSELRFGYVSSNNSYWRGLHFMNGNDTVFSIQYINQYQDVKKYQIRNAGTGAYETFDLNGEYQLYFTLIDCTRAYTDVYSADGEVEPYSLFRHYVYNNTPPPPEPTEPPPPPPPPEPTTIIDDILKPFTEVGAWIATFVTALLGIFYNVELGTLTFCGVLSIAVLGFAVMFLLIRVIENFTHFRS